MKLVTALSFSFSLAAVAACGEVTSPLGDDTPPATTDAGADAQTLGVPQHRPQSVTCNPTPTGPEPVIWDAGLPDGTRFDCQTNEDCTAHAGGRCIFTFMQPADSPASENDLGTRCLYDECTTDSDCPASSVCGCGNGGAAINSCSPVGNCRTDSDCASGYCSPSQDGCDDFDGYFCHTKSDECATDDDCSGKSGTGAACIVNRTSGVWNCQQVGCASAGGN